VPRPTSRLLGGSWWALAISLLAVLVGVLLGDWSSTVVLVLVIFGGMLGLACLTAIPLLATHAFSAVRQIQQLNLVEPLRERLGYLRGDVRSRRARALRVRRHVQVAGGILKRRASLRADFALFHEYDP